jgi:hypothetical protein
MKTKSTKLLYWASTILIFLFEGVMSLAFGTSQMSMDGMAHLGYPQYFGLMLVVFKVLGALALVLPSVKNPFKEWAYAGFGIVFISAAVSNWAVDGFSGVVVMAAVFLGILAVSRQTYNKLHA